MKYKVILIICFCIPTLSACWDRVELQDLAIVTAAAIDRIEDGKTRISVQIFIPRVITSGETGEDPNLGSTLVREGTGDNLADAISMLQLNVPRRLFWGQCHVYIFGSEQAKSGIRNEIDYFTRHPGPRGSSYVYVSDGEAKEIMTLIPPLERYSGKALRKLTQTEAGMITTIRDVDMNLMKDSESVSMPYIKRLATEEEKETHQTIPVIEGTAIFKKDKMVGTLDLAETRGLLWLKNKVRRSTVSVKPKEEDGYIIMTPTLGDITFTPRINENRWVMKLNLTIEGDIVQNETHLNLMNEDVIMELKSEFESVLKERVAQTAEKLQQEFNACYRFRKEVPSKISERMA